MKKTLFLCCFALSSYFVFAQLPSFPLNQNREIEYSEVVSCELPRDKLYSNAQEWIAKTFGDYKSVIQFEDKEEGKLIIKGMNRITAPEKRSATNYETIDFTITIECRDNRYRYIIDNVSITSNFSYLGHSMNTKLTPSSHRYTIENERQRILRIEREIDSLNTYGQSLSKNREIARNNESIREKESIAANSATLIAVAEVYHSMELQSFESLIVSLKSSMNRNDDF